MIAELVSELVREGKVHDLAFEWKPGMPHHPNHPPFLFSLNKHHGDVLFEGGSSAATDVFTLGGHVGTHIDALGHFSKNGKLRGDIDAEQHQTTTGGLQVHGIDQAQPIVARGVLLDVARCKDKAVLPARYGIDAVDLEEAAVRDGVEVREGDVVLIRTGWGSLWKEPRRYVAHDGAPGVNPDAARWLSERNILASGSDTLAYEVTPSAGYPVHIHFLIERGIHILEVLNLEGLSRDRAVTFLFIAAPLKIVGGTGSPVRPLAIT